MSYPHQLASILQNIELLVLDCDGVLTPADLYYNDHGERSLRFNARDGLALALMKRFKIPVAIISGRSTQIAEHRFKELGILAFIGDCRDKGAALEELTRTHNINIARTAFLADDLLDIPALVRCGLPIAVADAVPEVQSIAHWTTRAPGGRGAVREVCEAILKTQGHWEPFIASLSQPNTR